MFAKALLAFLALPGVVAFGVPVSWLLAADRTRLAQPLGLVLLAVGCVALLWCVRDFYVRGKGTLAPWSPPAHLVALGQYRYTRNPMYVAVTLILLAGRYRLQRSACSYAPWSWRWHSTCASCGEEPWLARTHGAQWHEYADRVPRWFW